MAKKITKQEKIKLLEDANEALIRLNNDLIGKVKIMESFLEEMQEDCTMGKHCEICIHRKVYHVNATKKQCPHYGDLTRVILCGKHESCKHFATEYKIDIPPSTDMFKPGVTLFNTVADVDGVIE